MAARNIKDKVKLAIESNVLARNLYNKSMHETSERLGYSKREERDLKENQVLQNPASEEDIQKLEEAIDYSLPPSYRSFLQLHNGWSVIDGSPNFFSVSQILDYLSSEDHIELIENALERGDDFVKKSLVVGASEGSPDRYLLNPKKVNAEGEWEFIDYEKLDYEVSESFLEFLIESEKTYRDSISENEDEEYFDPFK